MTPVTAAILVIGDEILSGRTQDANVQTIARALGPAGIRVREVRVVSDDQAAIVAALNALRAGYSYVFTTGGIGPTHDDITADAVAAAFGASIGERADALAILRRTPPHGPHPGRGEPDRQSGVRRAGVPAWQCVRHGGSPVDHARDAAGRAPAA
jgi:molybdenum cofactor synthesis domain-containing protein